MGQKTTSTSDLIQSADPAELRSLAAREKGKRMALRLFGIALLAEGKNCRQAADRLGVTSMAVSYWRKRFRAEGIEGLRDRPRSDRSRRPGLDAHQRAEVLALIRAEPRIARHRLWHFVRTRFGFDYSFGGLDRLVREDLGFVWRKGVLVPSQDDPAPAATN